MEGSQIVEIIATLVNVDVLSGVNGGPEQNYPGSEKEMFYAIQEFLWNYGIMAIEPDDDIILKAFPELVEHALPSEKIKGEYYTVKYEFADLTGKVPRENPFVIIVTVMDNEKLRKEAEEREKEAMAPGGLYELLGFNPDVLDNDKENIL